MKVLVTGGTGFIGSHLVELLLARGHDVRCLVRSTRALRWLRDMPVELVEGDLFTRDVLAHAVRGTDFIYHSAGVTKARTRAEYYRGNTDGTVNLLKATIAHNPEIRRFVHVSSQAAVGPSPGREPITEDAPGHPLTSYGKSKWQAEEECRAVMQQLPVTIVRPSVVYGERDSEVFEFFRTMRMGIQPMVGFHERFVSMIHVNDLVRGFVMAGETPVAAGQTYFITSPVAYGWKEIGDVARRLMKRRALRVKIPEPAVHVVAACAECVSLFTRKAATINLEKARDMVQDYWTCSPARAKKELGFEAAIGLEEGFARTIAWYRAQGWLPS